MSKVAISTDDAATRLKNRVTEHLRNQKIEVIDFSNDVEGNVQMYPNIAFNLAPAISKGIFERGILIFGIGVDVSIMVNKVPGVQSNAMMSSVQNVRAKATMRKSRSGARVVGNVLALMLVNSWMQAEFEAGHSTPKVDRIKYYESLIHPDYEPRGDKQGRCHHV